MLILMSVNLEFKSYAFMVMLRFAFFACIFPPQMFCGIHQNWALSNLFWEECLKEVERTLFKN